MDNDRFSGGEGSEGKEVELQGCHFFSVLPFWGRVPWARTGKYGAGEARRNGAEYVRHVCIRVCVSVPVRVDFKGRRAGDCDLTKCVCTVNVCARVVVLVGSCVCVTCVSAVSLRTCV